VSATDYFTRIRGLLDGLADTQLGPIRQAAEACAESIAAEKLVHLFGTGHGAIPAMEAFPRSGSIVGFRSIVELPITLLHHVWGDMGVPQYRFLHRQEGYGKAILEAHQLDPADTLVLFSGQRYKKLSPAELDDYVTERGKRGHKLPRGWRRVDALVPLSRVPGGRL
jgi:uncharacterized phosphosugar-binding protein